MCGIFGTFGTRPDRDVLEKMAVQLRHRGPDGKGLSLRNLSGMGMTRLAILDLEHGRQPFHSRDGRVSAVLNGEIYNWQELRRELESHGHEFRTRCDAEIIPAAWQQWGCGMLKRFNGMFALAIQDGEEVFLARDPCGQKPLYLARRSDGSHVFASEIRPLGLAGISLELARPKLEEWLALRYVPGPETLFAGVTVVPPGSMVRWQPAPGTGKAVIESWWTPPPVESPSPKPDALALQELGELVDDAVARTLQSDVPIAAYLSSGIDSSLLLDSIQRAGGQVQALTADFGAESDEGAAAERLAGDLGVSHHRIVLGPECIKRLPDVIEQMETPVADPLILAFDALGKATRDLGCKVAIGGEGPDELFLGYSFQRLLFLAGRVGKSGRAMGAGVLSAIPSAILEIMNPLPASLGRSGRDKLASWLGEFSNSSDWQRGIGLRTLFTPADLKRLLVNADWREPPLAEGESLIDRHFRHQFGEWLPDWSIIRQDRNAMAHSVEYRMPFLDPRLIEFSGTLSLDQKIRGRATKSLWRDLAKKRIPKHAARRPKQPFYFPIEHYGKTDSFRELAGDYLSPERLRRGGLFCPAAIEALQRGADGGGFLPWKQLTAILIFEIWRSTYDL